jgi:uncharacterized membrane protein
MDHNTVDINTKAGTLGGTLFIFFLNLSTTEVLKTVVLASVGAIVSFSVSFLLKILVGKNKK